MSLLSLFPFRFLMLVCYTHIFHVHVLYIMYMNTYNTRVVKVIDTFSPFLFPCLCSVVLCAHDFPRTCALCVCTHVCTCLCDQLLGLVDLGSQRTREHPSGKPRLIHALLRRKGALLCGGGQLQHSDDLLDGLRDGQHDVVPGVEGG